MTQTTDEIVIGLDGKVLAAPVGSTVPDDVTTAWDGAWYDLGYTTEDGIRLTAAKTTNEIRGWPSPEVLRRWIDTRDLMASMTLRQFNGDNLLTALGGGTIEETSVDSDVFRYTPPDADDEGEFMLGVEWVDGDYTYRMFFRRGVVDDDVEIPVNRQDSVNLPISYKAIKPGTGATFELLTDDPAFDPAA